MDDQGSSAVYVAGCGATCADDPAAIFSGINTSAFNTSACAGKFDGFVCSARCDAR